MPHSPRRTIAPGIYQDDTGIAAVVNVGSGSTRRRKEHRFAPGTPLDVITTWQTRTRTRLASLAPASAPGLRRGTLGADAPVYLDSKTAMPSYEARRADLEAWLPRFGQRNRHAIEARELVTQINEWLDAGVAASTINHRRQALRDLYLFFDPDAPAPLDGTSRVKPPPLEARALTWSDVREILAALPATKGGATLRVMALTGWPPARLARLLPEHLDAASRTVFLSGRLKGKGTKSKTLRVTPEACAALQTYVALFPTGGGVSKNSWVVAWHKVVGAVNAERAERGEAPLPRSTAATPIGQRLRPYDLRHSYGTEVYRRTGDSKAAAEMLDVTLETAERYTLGAVSTQVDKAVAAMSDPAPRPRIVNRADGV